MLNLTGWWWSVDSTSLIYHAISEQTLDIVGSKQAFLILIGLWDVFIRDYYRLWADLGLY